MDASCVTRGAALVVVMWALTATSPVRANAPRAPSSNSSPTFSCPFHHGNGTSVTSGSGGSSQSFDVADDEDDGDGDYDADDGDVGLGGHASWPDALGLRLEAGYGSVDWAGGSFSDPNDLVHVSGASLDLGRAALIGGELDVDVALGDTFLVTVGIGGYTPVGGRTGGDLSPAFGVDARTSQLRVLTFFGEAGLIHRFGTITSYAGMHTGVMGASVHFDAPCGCHGTFTATRSVLGPRLGVRVPLFHVASLEGSFFTDALHFPDWVLSLGIGFGQSAR